MKLIVDYLDEAAGMSRSADLEVEAETKEEALDKFYEQFKSAGPGIYVIGAAVKNEQQRRQQEDEVSA